VKINEHFVHNHVTNEELLESVDQESATLGWSSQVSSRIISVSYQATSA